MSNASPISAQKVLYEILDTTALITLNRPERMNALDPDMIRILTELIQTIQDSDHIRMIAIRGAGENFCSGADIDWMRKSIEYSKEQNYKEALSLAHLFHLMDHCTKPILCLVQGAAFGGAIGLVATSDIVVADTNAKFCFPEVRLGLIPAIVGPYAIRTLGEKYSRYFMITAMPFSADEANRLGLVHEVATALNIEKKIQEYAERLGKNSPKATMHTKQMITSLLENPQSVNALMEQTAALIAEIRVSDEAQEGCRAFLEKRSPHWQNG